eukprot:scaffold56059_cov31-Tisochrysis_lutea.AAC.2
MKAASTIPTPRLRPLLTANKLAAWLAPPTAARAKPRGSQNGVVVPARCVVTLKLADGGLPRSLGRVDNRSRRARHVRLVPLAPFYYCPSRASALLVLWSGCVRCVVVAAHAPGPKRRREGTAYPDLVEFLAK